MNCIMKTFRIILLAAVSVCAGNISAQVSESGQNQVEKTATTHAAMLDELIKKLPGVEMSDEGVVTIRGKEVKKILVDGKEVYVSDKSSPLKELVRKLPGMEMSADGSLKINGREVKKILVDGKEFYSVEDAALQDLLKKLPGTEISNDGTIRIHGREVKKILIEGKELLAD